MDSEKPPVIFLMGPTASGKTDLAIELRARLPVDLISVDSALVYRGMDIGTAKPSPEVLSDHPHALIDIRDPSQSYSAADFQREAIGWDHEYQSMREGALIRLLARVLQCLYPFLGIPMRNRH